VAEIAAWIATGPRIRFSDISLLIVCTGTTSITSISISSAPRRSTRLGGGTEPS